MNISRISDAIEEIGLRAMQQHLCKVESILHQLHRSGHKLSDMAYSHLPDDRREEITCQGIRVCVIVRKYEGLAITTRYELYPDGRPGGWPELSFGED
jgi:hypothetical protein